VELAADRPEDQWPRDAEGKLAMVTRPLDVDGLLAELDS
jgi:catechol 2,3-dioxygenase